METPKIEDPNKITIGDQEFQKVGEMKSEPTGLKNAPNKYDLYKDTEDGALMGKLPEYHPSNKLYFESKIKNLAIDLSQLTTNEVLRLIMDPSVKIYGEVSGTVRTKNGVLLAEHAWLGEAELEVLEKGSPLSAYSYYIQIKNAGDDCKVYIGKKAVNISYFKNSVTITEGLNRAAFSFYEIPEGYKELVEREKASE